MGVKRDDDAFQVWKDGMDAMIDKIKPETILVYGGKLEYAYNEDIEVKYFKNKVTERMKHEKKWFYKELRIYRQIHSLL